MATEKKIQTETLYSPSAIISIFRNLIMAQEEKRIITARGVYFLKGKTNYRGIWYDELRDESGENTITLLVPDLIRGKLQSNTTISFRCYITKKIEPNGTIWVHVNLVELLEQTQNKHSEEEVKKIEIINKKIDQGFKDVDSHIKQQIYDNRKPVIRIVHGKSAIIDQDIKGQMAEAIALFQVQFISTTITSVPDIIATLKFMNPQPSDVVVISRGGGDIDLKVFDKPELCEFCLGLPCFFVAAIGHDTDKPLLEKIADKHFRTPTALGQYLKETYNNTVEEFEQSKAKIVADVTQQLKVNYDKQVSVLNQQIASLNELHAKTLADKEAVLTKQIGTLHSQIKAEKELFQKTQEETAKNQAEQVFLLNQQIASLTELHAKTLAEKESVLSKQISALNLQITAEKQLHQKTQEEAVKNHTEQVLILNNKIKAFEDLMAKTIAERNEVHTTEIAGLRAQIEQLNLAHQQQKLEAESTQRERVEQLTEQIKMLQTQQLRAEEQLKEAQEEARNARLRADQAQSGKGGCMSFVMGAAAVGAILIVILTKVF